VIAINSISLRPARRGRPELDVRGPRNCDTYIIIYTCNNRVEESKIEAERARREIEREREKNDLKAEKELCTTVVIIRPRLITGEGIIGVRCPNGESE